MNRKYWMICMSLLALASPLLAQQLPLQLGDLYQPGLFNPAAQGTNPHHRVGLRVDSRHWQIAGFPSHTQSLTWSSPALGENGTLGGGLLLNRDTEFVLNRTVLLGHFAVHPWRFSKNINGPGLQKGRFSLGFSGGFIQWQQDLEKLRAWEYQDPLLNKYQVLRMNLRAGTDLELVGEKLAFRLGGSVFQLNEWMGREPEDTLIAVPHGVGHLQLQMSPGKNLVWAFNALWKDALAGPGSFGGGQLDIGNRFAFPRNGFWVDAGARLSTKSYAGFQANALHFGAGWRVLSQETLWDGRLLNNQLEVDLHFSWPLSMKEAIPRSEIGVQYYFGTPQKTDTIYEFIRGPFWSNESNLRQFLVERMVPGGVGTPQIPDGLEMDVKMKKNYVFLRYSYLDNAYQFRTADISGLEDLLLHIFRDVIPESTHPQSDWNDPPQEIREVVSLRITAEVKEDLHALSLVDSAGTAWFPKVQRSETIVLDGQDQNFQFPADSLDQTLNSLELAFLKISEARDFAQQVRRYQDLKGNNPEIKPLTIITNNPNLEGWQRISIELVLRKR